MQSPTWIRARELDQWAKSPQAKVLLPELIGRLVRATVPQAQLEKCDFPAEAETHRPGYDGTTVATQSTLYVPAGITYWEIGCDANPEQKAQSDYTKRLEEHEARVKEGEADDISQATFIAVTARDWHAKKGPTKKAKNVAKPGTTRKATRLRGMPDWAGARTKEKRYKTVDAYDSNRLEQWIREATAVALWLAKEMGKSVAGILDVQSQWLEVQAALRKPLPPEVLLVNRNTAASEFKNWVAGPAHELALRAPSAFEVVAVFAAWVKTLPEQEANAITARAVVVEDRDTWRALANSPHPLILIASPRLELDRELFAGATRKGHWVLRHADTRSAQRGGVELERMRRFDLEQALRAAGLEDAEARQVAQAAGGNYTILRRVFAKEPEVEHPAWMSDSTLATLLLAGAWEDERRADQEVIEKLAGIRYEDARAVAARWRAEVDAPLRLIKKDRGEGRIWEFLSPLDAWQSLSSNLSPVQIATFAEKTVEVLIEDSPALALPPDDRPMAAIKGKVLKFSHDLRQGLAEILAIGATREDESGIAKDLEFGRHAASVVRQVLPSGCSWKRWASLGQLLSSLAEAAPDEFLSAVERDLSSSDPQTVELMRQEISPSSMGGAAYHSGLLWALETAAWPSQHLHRVASILAQLTERDPGGKWTNRPLGSTARIFFSWRPQTVASVGERIDVLRMLCRNHPVAAWQIVMALIPKNYGGFFMDSAKPTYRDWAAGWTGEITYADYFAFLNAVAESAVHLAGEDPVRWVDFLDEVASFYSAYPDAYKKVRDGFDTIVSAGVSQDLKELLWQKLRVLVQQHTNYKDAPWALPPDEVAHWAQLRDRLTPSDPILELAHLFGSDGWDDPDESLSYEQKQERRAAERRAAIRTIWSAGGPGAVTRLAAQSGQPGPVGWSLAEEIADDAQPSIIPGFLGSGDEVRDGIGSAFAAQRIVSVGSDWAQSIPRADWSTAQVAAWAVEMPFGPQTWDWVASRGEAVEKMYWERIRSWGGGNLTLDEATRAFHNYLRARRPWDALQFLVSRKDFKQPTNTEMLCVALEAVLSDSSKRQIGTMGAHYLREALSFLQKPEAQADESRVARLELAFLPLLDPHFLLPRTLQRQLAHDPGFFVECLTLLFRPRGQSGEQEPRDSEEPTEEKRQLAQRIWRLLHDWRVVPGTNEQGIVVPDALRAWVIDARKKAEAVGRREVCDLHIGGVFAKSSADADEGVPLVAIRDVIEECKSEEIERGFMIGLHNLRGVVTRALYEGGNQEREIAKKYERHAQISSKWPRTARALRTVAKDYIREAEEEDERAQARE